MAQAAQALPAVVVDPAESARLAGLRYVNDGMPGLRRMASRGGFRYVDHEGAPVRDAATVQRVRKLAIPPAWTDVWICANPRGHLQATGRDARGRKQYRYHEEFRRVRDETKYERMVVFGAALPGIRERVDNDLALPGLPREKVLATIVRLLDTTCIRVGNEEYAQQNKSFGLTTMRNRHVDVEGSAVRFHFRGKAGKTHDVGLRDRRVASVIRRLQDIPGQELFQYRDPDGTVHSIDSADVNAYLHDITEADFTAKDFRTWAASVLAAWALQELGAYASEAQAKRNVVAAIETVSARLGNTPAVCRKCYVHPEVLNAHLDGSLLTALEERAEQALDEELSGLRSEEAAVLVFLRRRLADAAKG